MDCLLQYLQRVILWPCCMDCVIIVIQQFVPPSMGRAPSTVPMGLCNNAAIMGGTPPIIYNLVIMGSIRSRGNNPISVRDCSTTCCDVHFNAICSNFSSYAHYPGQGSQGFHLSISIQFNYFSFSVPFWPLALGFIFMLTQEN